MTRLPQRGLVRQHGIFAVAVIVGTLLVQTPAEAGLLRGLQYLAAGVFEIPRSVLVGTLSGPPILGTAFGAVGGAMRTVGYALGGTLELLGTAIPLAKKAVPLALPFLL